MARFRTVHRFSLLFLLVAASASAQNNTDLVALETLVDVPGISSDPFVTEDVRVRVRVTNLGPDPYDGTSKPSALSLGGALQVQVDIDPPGVSLPLTSLDSLFAVNLAVGDTVLLDFGLVYAADTSGVHTTNTTITAGAGNIDPNPSNNAVIDSFNVRPPNNTNLVVQQTIVESLTGDKPVLGDSVRLQVLVTNLGPDAYEGADPPEKAGREDPFDTIAFSRRMGITVDIDEPAKPGRPGFPIPTAGAAFDSGFAVYVAAGSTVTLDFGAVAYLPVTSGTHPTLSMVGTGAGSVDPDTLDNILQSTFLVIPDINELEHDIEQLDRAVVPGLPAGPDTVWIADWSFDGGLGCDHLGWVPIGSTARLHQHIPDNDPCTENLTCAWLFTDLNTPTLACVAEECYAPGCYVLREGVDEMIVSPWVSLATTPGAKGSILSFDIFPGNRYAASRAVLNWSLRSNDGGTPTAWQHQGSWSSLGLSGWVTSIEDLTPFVPADATEIQLRLHVTDWGPGGFGFATTSGNSCGPGPFLDRIRIGRRVIAGPVIEEGSDSRSQAQDAFPTEIDPQVTPAGEHHRPTMDRFGSAAFSRGGDLADGGLSSNLVTGDSIHVLVRDARGAGGITSINWYGRIVSGPHAGKAPPPWTVGGNGFFCVPADSSRNDQGALVQDVYFVDLDDEYFRGGDVLHYFWLAADIAGGVTSDPLGMNGIPLSYAQAVAATGGLHEVSFLPTIAWSPDYLSRIAADPHGKLDPTPVELSSSAQQNCILYVQMEDSRRRSGDLHRTSFMFTLDELGYRDSYDVYDHQGFGNTNNHLAGRATVAQATGYALIVHDAGRRRTSALPSGEELDSEKLDQAAWFRGWLANAGSSEAGIATLWVIGANAVESNPSTPLLTMDAAVAFVTSDQGINVNPDGVGRDFFTFSNGNVADFSGDQFSLHGGCPVARDYDALASVGSGVATHRYESGPAQGDAAIVMNAHVALQWNTIVQSHPWSDIVPPQVGPLQPTEEERLLSKVLNAVLPLACLEGLDPSVTPDDEEIEHLPKRTALHANVPNPFNPATEVRFDLAHATRVRLQIHDAAGRLTRTLIDAEMPAGGHRVVWDGTDALGRRVSSGVYFYQLLTGDFSGRRKMVLLR